VDVVSTSISRAGDHPGRLLHDPAGRTVDIAGPVQRDVTFVEVGTHADGDDLDNARDVAYRAKYRRWAGPVARITAHAARATTLRLDPA
jgi:hypothetical protein